MELRETRQPDLYFVELKASETIVRKAYEQVLADQKNAHYALKGTEFDSIKQALVWAQTPDFENALQKNTEDLAGFYLEYLSRRLVLPILAIIETNQEGCKRLVAHRYGGVDYVNIVSAEERRGAVKNTVETIAANLVYAPENSMFIFISPAGWSGKFDESGDPIRYEEAQVYMFRIDRKGDFQGATLRTGMKLDQVEKLVEVLSDGEFRPTHTIEEERIMAIVQSTIYSKNDFEFVLEKVQEVMGGEPMISDEKGPRTFAEARVQVKDIESAIKLDQEIQEVIDRFEEKMAILYQKGELTFEKIIIENGKAILEMQAIIGSYADKPPEIRHRKALAEVQQITGCVGRGVSKSGSATEGKFVRYCGQCGVVIMKVISRGFICPNCRGVYRGC